MPKTPMMRRAIDYHKFLLDADFDSGITIHTNRAEIHAGKFLGEDTTYHVEVRIVFDFTLTNMDSGWVTTTANVSRRFVGGIRRIHGHQEHRLRSIHDLEKLINGIYTKSDWGYHGWVP